MRQFDANKDYLLKIKLGSERIIYPLDIRAI